MNPICPILLAWITAAATLGAPAEAPPRDDQSVEEAGEALARTMRYPWYDPETDSLRRINPSAPRQMSTSNWSGGGGSLFSGAFGEFLYWLIWILFGGLLLAIAYLLLRQFLQRDSTSAVASRQAKIIVSQQSRLDALPVPLETGTHDLLGQARRYYEAGNYAQAMIYLFSYALVELDRQQFIHLARGKTNRQYLRELRSRPAIAGLYEQTMVTFEAVFFGRHPLDREHFESLWRRLDEFRALHTVGTA